MLSYITELEANIQTVNLHRMGKHIYPGYVQLELSVETKNQEHIEQLYNLLQIKGLHIKLEE
ncbi:hypothetical protein CCD97_10240 [Streptococcus agalactiae]|nr:hypothetical protein CCD97_10240 [Streptococcus agalactiae]